MALAPKCRLVYSAIDNLQVPRSRSMRRSSPISDFPRLRRRICASVAASAPRLAPLQVQASIAPGPCCTRWAAVWDLYRRLRTTPRGRACGHPRTCTRPPVRRYGLGPSPSRRAGDPCGASPLGSWPRFHARMPDRGSKLLPSVGCTGARRCERMDWERSLCARATGRAVVCVAESM